MAATASRTLRFALTFGLVLATAGRATAAVLGAIETPSYFSTQAGVALISGWSCTGQKIRIRIDDGPPQTAGSHTSREDTRPACGRADTGFGLLLNFNLLPPGQHTLTAYADGVAFAGTSFRTIRIGDPAVNGSLPRFPLLNFPKLGDATWVVWDRELQNFRADSVQTGPAVAGDYYGATTLSACEAVQQVLHATYTVTWEKGKMGVSIHYADGEEATFPPAPATLDGGGYVNVDYGDWVFSANGARLTGGLRRPLDEPSCYPLDTAVRAAK